MADIRLNNLYSYQFDAKNQGEGMLAEQRHQEGYFYVRIKWSLIAIHFLIDTHSVFPILA